MLVGREGAGCGTFSCAVKKRRSTAKPYYSLGNKRAV